jgi:type II secretory pathway component PulF
VDCGALDAEDIESARASLRERGLFVLSLESHGSRRLRRFPIKAAELALGLRILADLLESGLPITRALDAFEDLAPKGWRSGLPSIRQSVREGQGLARALSDAPIEIPALVIGIAQAGEAGSGVGPAIRRAAELTEATAENQAAIRAALAYPTIVAVAGVCAITILMTVVLPRFAKILSDLGQALPVSTRIVLGAASTARALVVPVAIGIGICLVAWRAWTAADAGRRAWHRSLLSVPVVGSIRRAAAVARMAHSLGALLESGVNLTTALGLAARATGDAELESRVLAARTHVSSGKPLSHALDSVDAATQTAARLIRAGEESGRVPAMLAHAARIEQQRADRFIRTAVRMLEPTLLLLFACVVALVAAALLQAIYSVRPTA